MAAGRWGWTAGIVAVLALSGCAPGRPTETRIYADMASCSEAQRGMDPAFTEYNPLNLGVCSGSDRGPWTLTYEVDRVSADGSMPGGGGFAGFLVFALLWAAIPPFIGAGIAAKHGTSVGLAIALCIFLGWAGLALVYFASDRSRRAMTLGTIDRAFGGNQPTVSPQTTSVEERLRKLDDLHARGVLSAEERAQRRREILEEI